MIYTPKELYEKLILTGKVSVKAGDIILGGLMNNGKEDPYLKAYIDILYRRVK